ncbi:DUF4386 family protein [Streptomyces sp. SID13031]|uniref:DUF4386 family protein n=1 Tax=Streptomyces sp. SID13031 TaxID=2706046 RepID=UPI0013CD1BE2|nr:DUF4386 family protein [Streptomyces sp. SID13031]NEA30135.1 DUF4386 family protein [Streptomyces sp. SID13031]
MTTTANRTTTVADTRGISRWAAAIVLPIGPAAVAVLRFVLPYDTVDDAKTMAAKVIAEPGRASVVLWMGFIAVLTLVPAAYAAGKLTRRRAPKLTLVALALLIPGYLSLGWLVGEDQLLWSGAHAGLDAGGLTRIAEAVHPTGNIAGVFFVLGHVVGTILLGVALWRSQVVARWAAIAVIVSQPIHFVAAVIVPNHTLDLVGWGLQAVGFAAVGWAILQLRNDDWDLPALP